MKKVLLINPPGKKKYIRGYFCSQTTKAYYFPAPVDLVVLSGWLAREYDVFLLDAINRGLSVDQCLDEMDSIGPDAVVALCGMVSWEEDAAFFSKFFNLHKVPVIGIGDVFLEDPYSNLKENEWLSAVVIDFTNDDILAYLNGDFDSIRSMTFRRGADFVSREVKAGEREFAIPLPKHELFIDAGYWYPFVYSRRYSVMLTDFACPYHCLFCVMGTFPYKYRRLENIIQELDALHYLKVRDILFMDQSFGAVKSRNLELYQEMIKKEYGFRWVCFSRVDLVDEETLALMKQSGCHTIIFGVETASDNILKQYRKGYTKAQVEEIFGLCRKLGIRTVGTFILGLPEDTRKSCIDTINFACSLKCDFASFNFAFPRTRTELSKRMFDQNLVADKADFSDQSGLDMTIKTYALSSEDLVRIRRYAVWRFYLRPGYLLHRIFNIRSWYEVKMMFLNAIGLFKKLISP
jgi:radical SAM superfamily enzyme YgiQ (UPF0313 family)